jgi:adenylate cyclase
MGEQRTGKFLTKIGLARVVGAALTLLALTMYAAGTPLLDLLELKTYDLRLRALRSAPPQQVAIAAIDERSLAEYGRWPWSRAVLARLVERLSEAGARVIAFDVFFVEPESPEADERFARAIRASGNVVLSTVFLLEAGRSGKAGSAGSSIAAQAIGDVRHGGNADFPMRPLYGVLANIPVLQRSAAYAGHVNVDLDADGTLRRIPLVHRWEGRYYPSFDVQIARDFLGVKELALDTASYGVTGIRVGERRLPTDEYGRLLVRYRGAQQTFPTVSVADILKGRADPALLRGRAVLIGSTAAGIGDVRVTPWGKAYPGIEVHANVVQSLLEGEALQRPDWMAVLDGLAILALGLLLVWLLPRFGVAAAALLALAVLGGWVALANALFQTQGLWLNVVYPALLVPLVFGSTTLVQYFSTESEKRQLKTAFQYYVPPKVVEEIAADTSKLRLGGEKRELTVLFSDIRGFTSVSETLEPEDLVRLLNGYFTDMTNIVFEHKGSLDKYIGDAIMAVFGAPVAEAEHPRLACRAALDMMKALGGLQKHWRAEGLPAFDIGIGINTGPMVVGNMGSVTRFNYTVIGDAVNLASRIESLNKVYGTGVLVSETTYGQVKDEFPRAREIDRISVRGRSQVVGIYELIPEGRYARLDWLPEFAEAYRMLRAGERERAAERFDALAARFADPVSAYHAKAIRAPRQRESDY